MEGNKGRDLDTIGCGFSAFKEVDEVTSLIEQLKTLELPMRTIEKNRERFNFILTQYLDQPQLLDPYIDNILDSMLSIIRDDNISEELKHNVFKYIFIVMSVKTYKKIITHLPHEVMDLIPVLKMLESQDPSDLETWQTRYVLLIWLSIISKIPFPLSRLEASDNIDSNQSIIGRIREICRQYCLSKDSCSVAAVFLLTNFLTRSDVKKLYLKDMINWCLENITQNALNHRPVAVLASILKHGEREDLNPFSNLLLEKVLQMKLTESPDDLVRKYAIKVVQRIGFILLKTKPASWHYQRANQSIKLVPNIPKETGTVTTNDDNREETFVADSDDNDIPPIVEDIFEQLIQGLRDKTIMIRWSSAKGVGRITSRLSIDLADDVVGYVLNLFSARESDSAWHGGCLALAELGRRGLLLPHRLKDAIPLVFQALVFDEPRAYGPVGSIIRDAACYVCWSFARAFEPEIFEPYVKEMAANLLIVTCFDREINCRRAASAAFQENVGRQGNFPHGIEIFTVADYFDVGVRHTAYLQISMQIALYPEYTKPLIDHLVSRKVTHWDAVIRDLASRALYNLAGYDPSYMATEVLPKVLTYLNSIDLNVRHGAVLAISEILDALNHNIKETPINKTIGDGAADQIENIVRQFHTRGKFKGLGGELMKEACALLIQKCSIVHFELSSPEFIHDWQNFLEDCLSHEVSAVRARAAEAHTGFYSFYYGESRGTSEDRNKIVNRYIDNLRSSNQVVRIGFAKAIGHFPFCILSERIRDIVESLIACAQITDDTLLWAESRKEAIHALTTLSSTLECQDAEVWRPFSKEMFDCYLHALEEYTSDSRGDIGSWVREAAISGLHVQSAFVAKYGVESVMSEDMMGKIIGGVARQAVERIDKTRAHAGAVFSEMIYSTPPLKNIPSHEQLKEIFPYDDCKNSIDWKRECETFPRFMKMLSLPAYTENILLGSIYSVGGLTESLVKHSSMSLFSYLKSQVDKKAVTDLCGVVADIFEASHKDERLISSILAFLERLLSSGCIQSILDDPENEIPHRWLTLLKRECKHIHATQLHTSSIKVICQFLQIRGSVSKSAFCQLSIYLCHKFKYLRKTTAVRLYEALTLYGEDMDLTEEDLASLLAKLNATDWEGSIDELRPIRNQLCELMKVPAPVLQKKSKTDI